MRRIPEGKGTESSHSAAATEVKFEGPFPRTMHPTPPRPCRARCTGSDNPLLFSRITQRLAPSTAGNQLLFRVTPRSPPAPHRWQPGELRDESCLQHVKTVMEQAAVALTLCGSAGPRVPRTPAAEKVDTRSRTRLGWGQEEGR